MIIAITRNSNTYTQYVGEIENDLLITLKNILNYVRETSIASKNNEYFGEYLQYIVTTESQDIQGNDDSSNNEEQINRYKCVVCNINCKNALNYNIHIRDDDACSIYLPQA